MTTGGQQRERGCRWLAVAAALLGLTAVLLGAAGSHVLDIGADSAARRWNIALQIHFFQAAALLAQAALAAAFGSVAGSDPARGRNLLWPAWLQFTGTLLFCGSLYLRALQLDWLPGWLTPTGGLVLLAGWLLLIVLLRVKPATKPG